MIIASIAMFWGAFYWLDHDLKKQTAAITEARYSIRRNAGLLETLANLKNLLPRVKLYEGKLNNLIHTRDELIDFPRYLEDLARRHNLAMNFSFQGVAAPAEAEQAGSQNFSLDISGSYDALERFLKELELTSVRYVAQLDNLDVSRQSEGYRILTRGRVFFR